MTGDDWEEKMLDQLERLLSNMGMNMSREQLRGLLKQFRSQFEAMGIDEERIAKGDVNFNFDLSSLKDMFQPGMDFGELFKNMGVDCLLYTSDAADDSLRVDLGGRRIIKKPTFESRSKRAAC